ncbi:uncharacterized protein LOC128548960 [Mercenaria mercenaria]|uniref:uncharacterized protein LOC128548960 n=1 Tax=Mercenaria mercenaria TaxID=6596 RepID=UPI00234F401A|nr:uncharacterized protein LOC128548960 [Mercenaria mercenaria]XP_053380744.1 uncharacterized protein LOC128548960 [Mercenaria mercenaria]XP_053380745.1 uncharacterized protein LOC128548960 [Mercenaria mercenaria]
MVVFTGAAVVTVITGGAAAGPIAAGIGTAAGTTAAGVGTGAAVGTAVGVGTAGGAIAGAGVAGTATGAGIGAVAGGTAAAGVGGSGAGLGALVATVGTGGWGLLAVGTSVNSEDGETTYDCWKPVVHDKSTEPSSGMLLKDMICHPNVTNVTMTTGICTELPSIVIENIWNETFEIQYLVLHNTGKIACHAKPVHE